MSEAPQLHWLPAEPDFRAKLKALIPGEGAWDRAVALANTRLDFVRTNALDESVRRLFDAVPKETSAKPVRLALLGSSTLAHLHAGIRVAALRRGIPLTIYENDFGQYFQELVNPDSELHRFAPTMVLFAFDARHLTQGLHPALGAAVAEAFMQDVLARIKECWRLAREAFHCPILHQTALNTLPALLGNNEHRLAGSPHAMIARLNGALRSMAEDGAVDLVALDDRAARDGLRSWHDEALWHRSKQEVALPAAPMYGELVGRLIAAKQGRSSKCLVLDLDNTLWGGVIGDDGLEGIVLGQGSPLGEGFAAVQSYARDLSRRGVILAVSSKNDEANALEVFDKHPEMVLRRGDIACFRANWNDKASNIRAIAKDLNIGLDAIVFLDDNPFERALVRSELPAVAVPEVPDEPALVPTALAEAGYFEGVAVTEEDAERTRQYQSNRARESLKAESSDLDGYLRSLDMQLTWRRFDTAGLQRIVQLINKTNQFNLTTRRYTEDEVVAVMTAQDAFGLQLRLLDKFGDNGIIAIVIGRKDGEGATLIDTWLMSCRVLGRQVEAATLNVIAAEARRLKTDRLVGLYRPTQKNGMVRDHYAKLGFEVVDMAQDGTSTAVLDLSGFHPAETFIDVREV